MYYTVHRSLYLLTLKNSSVSGCLLAQSGGQVTLDLRAVGSSTKLDVGEREEGQEQEGMGLSGNHVTPQHHFNLISAGSWSRGVPPFLPLVSPPCAPLWLTGRKQRSACDAQQPHTVLIPSRGAAFIRHCPCLRLIMWGNVLSHGELTFGNPSRQHPWSSLSLSG